MKRNNRKTIGIILCSFMIFNTLRSEIVQTSLSIGVNSPKSVSQSSSAKNSVESHDITAYGEAIDINTSILSQSRFLNVDYNPFIYSHAYYDPETGFNYMKARYQNPALMRFISQDSEDLKNRYNYANADPINNFDPSGHMPWRMYNIILTCLSFVPVIGNIAAIVHGAITKNWVEMGLGIGFLVVESVLYKITMLRPVNRIRRQGRHPLGENIIPRDRDIGVNNRFAIGGSHSNPMGRSPFDLPGENSIEHNLSEGGISEGSSFNSNNTNRDSIHSEPFSPNISNQKDINIVVPEDKIRSHSVGDITKCRQSISSKYDAENMKEKEVVFEHFQKNTNI